MPDRHELSRGQLGGKGTGGARLAPGVAAGCRSRPAGLHDRRQTDFGADRHGYLDTTGWDCHLTSLAGLQAVYREDQRAGTSGRGSSLSLFPQPEASGPISTDDFSGRPVSRCSNQGGFHRVLTSLVIRAWSGAGPALARRNSLCPPGQGVWPSVEGLRRIRPDRQAAPFSSLARIVGIPVQRHAVGSSRRTGDSG